VRSEPFVHALAAGASVEIGAQAVHDATMAAATATASFHAVRMARIIAHLANSRQHLSTPDMERPPSRSSTVGQTEGSGAG
jgi:hypothetical protein